MCPSCGGAGGGDWRVLGWANCTRCNGTGSIPEADIYWAALAQFDTKEVA